MRACIYIYIIYIIGWVSLLVFIFTGIISAVKVISNVTYNIQRDSRSTDEEGERATMACTNIYSI